MKNQTAFKKIINFTLTKIIIGVLVIVGSVVLVEWIKKLLTDKFTAGNALADAAMAIIEALMALLSYILLFRFYEKRQIAELSLASFWKNTGAGFFAGLILQSLIILIIYIAGSYAIISVNPASFILPAFTASFVAGFVAEIIIRGIIFRLTEKKLGTVITVLIAVLIFIVAHAGVKGATLLSILSTSVQAGVLLSAVYVYTRALWFPIFLHFAWDFAGPGIYGVINPGISVDKSLINCKVSGSVLLTGGQFGPGNSIQALLFCSMAAALLLWLAKRKNNFIKPYFRKATLL